MLRVIMDALKGKMDEINAGKLPTKSVQGEVKFHAAGKGVQNQKPGVRAKRVDRRWEGAPSWEIDADLDKVLIFPIVTTTRCGDLESSEDSGAPAGVNSAMGIESWRCGGEKECKI